MTKTKSKLLALLFGVTMLAAMPCILGMAYSKTAAAEEVCTHEYGEGSVHAPTCTAEGYTEYTCTLCGESYKDDFTDRAEHAYSEVVIEPTCTHEGYTTHFCTVCGYEYTDNYTSATGHTYQEATVLPTCTEEGYTTHTCLECGYSFNDAYVAALGHNYETEVIAPTCTEDGYTVYTCTVCEYSNIGDETEAIGHAYALNTVEATCVTYGYTEHVCANCSDRFVTDYIAALGHDYKDEVIPAEDGKIGYTKHTCQRCEYSYLSDFVTSGDDGYIGDEEHTHVYIFQMENDEEGQRLHISYSCECGEAYGGELVILFTDAEGIGTILELAADGTADYSALNGTYRVTITGAEGELLADFELTNGEEEEHTHVYVFESEDNAEERYFTFRYACECGEAYPGALYISYTAGDGETGTLTANEEGVVDYSMLEGACHILIETETEVLYELELPAVQLPDEPEEPNGGNEEEPEQPDEDKDEQLSIPGDGADDNEQDKLGDENDGQTEDKGNTPTLAILFVLLGVLAACGIAVFIAKKRKTNTEKK